KISHEKKRDTLTINKCLKDEFKALTSVLNEGEIATLNQKMLAETHLGSSRFTLTTDKKCYSKTKGYILSITTSDGVRHAYENSISCSSEINYNLALQDAVKSLLKEQTKVVR